MNALLKKGVEMIITKRLLLRIFFIIELICFGIIYFFGAQGIVALQKRKQEIEAIKMERERLQGLVKQVESSLYEWAHKDFLKEKIAREELHMARPGEFVYIFD